VYNKVKWQEIFKKSTTSEDEGQTDGADHDKRVDDFPVSCHQDLAHPTTRHESFLGRRWQPK
jgi:hypothetical protein